jgi:cyclic pyranopterin phosphate synthase
VHPWLKNIHVCGFKKEYMSEFTHLDKDGQPAIVNVGGKKVTHRKAVAQAIYSS